MDFASIFYLGLAPTLTYEQFCQFPQEMQRLLLRESILKKVLALDSRICPKCAGRYECKFQLVLHEYEGYFGRCSENIIDDVPLQPEQYECYQCDQTNLLSYIMKDIVNGGYLLEKPFSYDQYVASLGKLICKSGIYPLYFECNEGNNRISNYITPNFPSLVVVADLKNSKIGTNQCLYVPFASVLDQEAFTFCFNKLESFIQQYPDLFSGALIPAPTSQKDFISQILSILEHVEWVIRLKRGWELFEFKCEYSDSYQKRKIQKFVHETKIHSFVDCVLQSFLRNTPFKVEREIETGSGKIDFEISYGQYRAFLEAKKFESGKFELGLSNQLPQYLEAGMITLGVYLVINFDRRVSKEKIKDDLQPSLSLLRQEGKEIHIYVINAFPKKGASSELRDDI